MPTSAINLEAFPDSAYARQLLRQFAWLKFEPRLEAEYCRYRIWGHRTQVRAFMALLPISVIAWIVGTGHLLDPSRSALQVLLVSAMLVGGNWLAWSRHFGRLYLPIVTPLAALVTLAAAYQIPHGPVTDGRLEAATFIFDIPLMTHLFLGFPFYRALTLNLACAAVLWISAMYAKVPPEALSTFSVFVPTALMVATALAYTAERDNRKHFLQEGLLREISARDPLTALQNRASFDSHLEKLWRLALGSGATVGLLLIDIDHFKMCNDTFGHQIGDECLRRIATVLKTHAQRPLDLAARYGGEELALIQSQTTLNRLLQVAEEVRAEIETMNIPNPNAPRKIVTVSSGLAVVVPKPGRSVHALIQMADEALYLAKSEGRNCVRANESDLAHVITGVFNRKTLLRVVN